MSNNDLKQLSQLLDEKLDQKLEPIQKTLDEHGKILNSHTEILKSHDKLLKSHGKLLKSLKKNQEVMLDLLDREQMTQKKRIKKIEERVGISSQSY